MISTIHSATLSELFKLSAELGSDPTLVQAAGGNTSVKCGQSMWIKASGKWLADACRESLFVPVDIGLFHAACAAGLELPVQQAVIGESSLRPSIETALHAVLPYTYVLHVHPVSILAHAVLETGKESLAACLVDLPWAWIPYVQPGWGLAQEVAAAAKADCNVQVFVLANHGLVVAGNDLQATAELLRQVVALAGTSARPLPTLDDSKMKNWLKDAQRRGLALRAVRDPFTHALALDPISFQHCQAGVLYPDQAVFLGAEIYGCATTAANCDSPYEVVKGVGVFVADSASASVEAMLLCHAEVLARIAPDARLCNLCEAEVNELVDWDAEKYRRSGSR